VPQPQRRLGLASGVLLAVTVALAACSDGRWQSDIRPDTSPRTVRVVRVSSLAVPSARFIIVVFEAGHRSLFGLGLKRDEHLVRARVVVRLPDREGEQDCSLDAACQSLYMEENDIDPGLIPLRMRGTVTLKRGWRGCYVSAHLRIIPKDENDQSQRYVGRGGSFLNLDLKAVRIKDDPGVFAELRSWRELGGSSRLPDWQNEIAPANTEKP
jgi:hypothetical protein